MADQSLDLISQLESDLKQATLARDAVRTNVLRLLKAALQNQKIELGHDLNSHEMLAVLQKEAKKRHDAATAYTQANRVDLASQENTEAEAIEKYLPPQLSDAELASKVDDVITRLGAKSPADIGKVMAAVMGEVAGRADGGRVNKIVVTKLHS